MPKHKAEDYKFSAVKYYLKNDFSMEYIYDIYELMVNGECHRVCTLR